MTAVPWRQMAVSALALFFFCLLGPGATAAEACCTGAFDGMNPRRGLPEDLPAQDEKAAPCCCCGAACHCCAPESPFPDGLPQGVLHSSAGEGPERHVSAFGHCVGPMPAGTHTRPDLKAWLSGTDPPFPLFLFHLALLC